MNIKLYIPSVYRSLFTSRVCHSNGNIRSCTTLCTSIQTKSTIFQALGHNKEFVNVLGKNHCMSRSCSPPCRERCAFELIINCKCSKNLHVQFDRYPFSSKQQFPLLSQETGVPFVPFNVSHLKVQNDLKRSTAQSQPRSLSERHWRVTFRTLSWNGKRRLGMTSAWNSRLNPHLRAADRKMFQPRVLCVVFLKDLPGHKWRDEVHEGKARQHVPVLLVWCVRCFAAPDECWSKMLSRVDLSILSLDRNQRNQHNKSTNHVRCVRYHSYWLALQGM